MATITQADKDKLMEYLSRAQEDEKNAALQSRNSFFKWLEDSGLIEILKKLVNLVWEAIKELLGW